jgi:hypothetical protein
VRGPDDGSAGFALNINRLQRGVCNSCARTRLAALRGGALERGDAPMHAPTRSLRRS